MYTFAFVIVILLTLVLWIWAFIDLFKKWYNFGMIRIGYLILILSFPLLGSILYFQLSGRKRERKFSPDFNHSPRS